MLFFEAAEDDCFFVQVNQVGALNFRRLAPSPWPDQNPKSIELLHGFMLQRANWRMFSSSRPNFEFALSQDVLITLHLVALIRHQLSINLLNNDYI